MVLDCCVSCDLGHIRMPIVCKQIGYKILSLYFFFSQLYSYLSQLSGFECYSGKVWGQTNSPLPVSKLPSFFFSLLAFCFKIMYCIKLCIRFSWPSWTILVCSIKFTSDSYSIILTSFSFMAEAPMILVLALLFLSFLLLKFGFLNKLENFLSNYFSIFLFLHWRYQF